MSNNTGNNKSYSKKVIFIAPRDPKTGKLKEFKYKEPEPYWAGKIKDGKWVPNKPFKKQKPEPFIYPRDPKTGKRKKFTPKAKKMKGGKY